MILCSCLKDSVLLLCTWHGSSPSTNFPAWTICALFWPLCQRSNESSDFWNISECKHTLTPPDPEPTFSIFFGWHIYQSMFKSDTWNGHCVILYLKHPETSAMTLEEQWNDETLRCWLFAPLPSKLLFWARQSRWVKVLLELDGGMMGRFLTWQFLNDCHVLSSSYQAMSITL